MDTAEPGSPINFALSSFPAWNSAHQRSRKVTPSPSPIVNATRFEHTHDSGFSGFGSAIVNASPTTAKNKMKPTNPNAHMNLPDTPDMTLLGDTLGKTLLGDTLGMTLLESHSWEDAPGRHSWHDTLGKTLLA